MTILQLNLAMTVKNSNLLEYKNGKWVKSTDLDGWRISGIQQSEWGKAYQLSKYFKVYDWVADDGYNNFDKWIE